MVHFQAKIPALDEGFDDPYQNIYEYGQYTLHSAESIPTLSIPAPPAPPKSDDFSQLLDEWSLYKSSQDPVPKMPLLSPPSLPKPSLSEKDSNCKAFKTFFTPNIHIEDLIEGFDNAHSNVATAQSIFSHNFSPLSFTPEGSSASSSFISTPSTTSNHTSSSFSPDTDLTTPSKSHPRATCPLPDLVPSTPFATPNPSFSFRDSLITPSTFRRSTAKSFTNSASFLVDSASQSSDSFSPDDSASFNQADLDEGFEQDLINYISPQNFENHNIISPPDSKPLSSKKSRFNLKTRRSLANIVSFSSKQPSLSPNNPSSDSAPVKYNTGKFKTGPPNTTVSPQSPPDPRPNHPPLSTKNF
ncbi:hypothetical protein AYI68_g5805, partial [Smittium mucronatum]